MAGAVPPQRCGRASCFSSHAVAIASTVSAQEYLAGHRSVRLAITAWPSSWRPARVALGWTVRHVDAPNRQRGSPARLARSARTSTLRSHYSGLTSTTCLHRCSWCRAQAPACCLHLQPRPEHGTQRRVVRAQSSHRAVRGREGARHVGDCPATMSSRTGWHATRRASTAATSAERHDLAGADRGSSVQVDETGAPAESVFAADRRLRTVSLSDGISRPLA
jgi:hypothetical protein